jgi:hypothetical protein
MLALVSEALNVLPVEPVILEETNALKCITIVPVEPSV